MRRSALTSLLTCFAAAAVVVAAAAAAVATPLHAQTARVDLVLPSGADLATDPPAVRTIGVLAAGRTAKLIQNGFPARLHYKLELWAAGSFVNHIKTTVEWEFIIQYDPLAKTYKLIRTTARNATLVGEYTDLEDADAKLAEPYPAPISPPRHGEKSYYTLSLTVEAMSLGDLDEVQRWLRGELRPAVRGHRNPGAAVSTGLRTLVVRILGGERVVYQASTGVFRP